MSPGPAGPSRTNSTGREAAIIFSNQPHNSWEMRVLVRRASEQGTWTASATPGKRQRQPVSGAVLSTSSCTASYKVKRKMKNGDICDRQRVNTKHLVVKELFQ